MDLYGWFAPEEEERGEEQKKENKMNIGRGETRRGRCSSYEALFL